MPRFPDSSAASSLTHVDRDGTARMVDVSGKRVTKRTAVAEGFVSMRQATLQKIQDNDFRKGDVLTLAKIAGVMLAKRTSELIPLAHNIPLENIQVTCTLDPEGPGVRIVAEVTSRGRTGTEMEALTAVSGAALTLYDMCKAVDRGMTLTDIRLVRKSGGKSGTWRRETAGDDE